MSSFPHSVPTEVPWNSKFDSKTILGSQKNVWPQNCFQSKKMCCPTKYNESTKIKSKVGPTNILFVVRTSKGDKAKSNTIILSRVNHGMKCYQ